MVLGNIRICLSVVGVHLQHPAPLGVLRPQQVVVRVCVAPVEAQGCHLRPTSSP